MAADLERDIPMIRFHTLLLCLFLSSSALGQTGFSSLEEQMTGKEFMAAGLGKLSPEELESLNEWIRSHSLGSLDSPKSTASAVRAEEDLDRRGLPSEKDDDDSPIVSRLIGKFSGWDGQTVFKLENGQIWMQSSPRDLPFKEGDRVTIKSGTIGGYILRSESGTSTRVQRIE